MLILPMTAANQAGTPAATGQQHKQLRMPGPVPISWNHSGPRGADFAEYAALERLPAWT